MPKIKLPRNNPSIDMTPMVDLGFLLVTFFMLTSQFRPAEPVTTSNPASIADAKIPESDLALFTVDSAGHVFYTVDGPEARMNILNDMGEQYKIQFSDLEKQKFSNLTSFGLPITQMKDWLSKEGPEFKKYPMGGIPSDTLNKELYHWIYFTRRHKDGMKLRFAIKGDRKTHFKQIRRVIDVLGEHKIYKLNLVTDMKIES